MDKQQLRERIWDELEETGEARFPFPPHGRIPNFAGARDAAERLAERPEWVDADAIKANPDSPQRFARERALREGKTVYMAVPRLSDEQPFYELDPATIDDPGDAATLSGVEDYGVRVPPEDVDPIDLVIAGSVAVTEDGARVGKGEGYSDLEYAVLSELGLVDEQTTVATTVHELQVVAGDVPVETHDVPLDLVVTPDRAIETATARDRPAGIEWDLLDDERVEEIPVLDRFRE